MNAIEAIHYLKSKPPGMPVFCLLAKDPDAAKTVRDWAARHASRPYADGEKVAGAMRIASAMEDWRIVHRFDIEGWSIMPLLRGWTGGLFCGSAITLAVFCLWVTK